MMYVSIATRSFGREPPASAGSALVGGSRLNESDGRTGHFRPWGLGILLLLGGYLLFAHGCHGDEDNELLVRRKPRLSAAPALAAVVAIAGRPASGPARSILSKDHSIAPRRAEGEDRPCFHSFPR